jgi:hypothetical protein
MSEHCVGAFADSFLPLFDLLDVPFGNCLLVGVMGSSMASVVCLCEVCSSH